MADLERLFRPKSIAAIGGLQASRVIEQCQLLGYEGEIWTVHPNKEEVRGLRAYKTIEELPGSPDAADGHDGDVYGRFRNAAGHKAGLAEDGRRNASTGQREENIDAT